jgi:hypothetical protein
MKLAVYIAATAVLFAGSVAIEAQVTKNYDVVVAGKGWGKIQVGASRTAVESVLGQGTGEEANKNLDGVYFREYDDKGIQVSFTNKDDKIVAIFFYNKQHRYERMAVAPVRTEKGIGWQSSYEDVKRAYGKAYGDYSQGDWRRIVFDGIDFRFEKGALVRIGIPGR